MSNRWDFYFKQADGYPASVFVDLGIVAAVPDQARPHLTLLWVYMRDPQPNGFSSSAEAPALGAIEDSLVPSVSGFASFVGRVTTAGRREFYFYSADSQQCEQTLIAGMKAHDAYRFDVSSRDDRGWSHYLGSLYPGAEDRLRIRNRHMLEALRKNGDDPAVARPVDHWVYFTSPEDRTAFLAAAAPLGYSVHAEDYAPREGRSHPYGVIVQRTDSPAKIDGVTIELFRLAEAHHGQYGDWGAFHAKAQAPHGM